MLTRLGVDLGELPDEPIGLWEAAHVAHVACGGHAGDAASMRLALARCRTHGVAAGAHPSWPDRARFGRVSLGLGPDALRDALREQLTTLRDAAGAEGVRLGHVKPHGALYHDADRDPALAAAVVEVAREVLGHVALVGLPNGALAAAAAAAGLPSWTEAFPERGTLPDGRLVPRGQPGALVTDPAVVAARARALRGTVDLLCVHGDSPGAVELARAVRAELP